MKIFIINLAQSTDRLQAQTEQFAKLGLTFERLPAVTVDEISHDFYQKHLTCGQRVMKQTEFACLLSHKKAWEQVLARNEPCLILEDDAVVVQDFAQILRDLEATSLTTDLINLEVHGRKKIVGREAVLSLVHDRYQLRRLWMDKSGAAGYILHPSGAKKLLAYAERVMGLADAVIYSCPDLISHQIEPAALLQSDKCAQYGVPFHAYPMRSMIGEIKNTHTAQPTLGQKMILKKNRIVAQFILGIRTLQALMRGEKREIRLDKERF